MKHSPGVLNSSPDSLPIFAGITPPARIYRSNYHGTYIPCKWSTRATYPDLHICCLCRAFAWNVTLIRRLQYIGHCARGGHTPGSRRRDDRGGRSPSRHMSGRSGARRGTLVAQRLPRIRVGRTGHVNVSYKSVLAFQPHPAILYQFFIEKEERSLWRGLEQWASRRSVWG